MPGMSETVILLGVFTVAVALILAPVLRLRKKFGPDTKPTIWTCVNELGGYAFVGVVVLILMIGWLISRLLGS